MSGKILGENKGALVDLRIDFDHSFEGMGDLIVILKI